MLDPARIGEIHGIAHTAPYATMQVAAPRDASVTDDEAELRLWQWLGALSLLKGVPFHYLVPDERMLPAESIRFFQVDPSWIESLLDGAFSLGRVTEANQAHDQAFSPRLHGGAEAAASIARPQNLRAAARNMKPLAKPASGFLLRSSAVTHWPGIEVEGRRNQVPVHILRLERLHSVLLCLFDQAVDTVSIHQPSEGVHFGFLESEGQLIKKLRRLKTDAGGAAGSTIEGDPLTAIPYREAAGTLRIAGLAASLAGRIGLPVDKFTAAEFALEMVAGAGQVTFTIG
jgi:hypothetical protein